jgi:hypothetical protein
MPARSVTLYGTGAKVRAVSAGRRYITVGSDRLARGVLLPALIAPQESLLTAGFRFALLVGVDYVDFLIAGRSRAGLRAYGRHVKRVKNAWLDAVKAALYTSGRLPRINELTGAVGARVFYEG